ncbi:MAG: L-threonylcarbamoyladenylate synthase, partial [Patescibacteria group bacterium]|nr:L-threonylcarbamoyladenylate synthase [Patescibacteria group bacterium]
MKVIKFNLNDFDMNIVREAARVLRGGGCVVYPTDTAYALGVDAFNAAGIERLFKIKKRPKIKPIPIMVRDIETAKRIAYIDKKTEKILEGIWPGAVTAILNKREVIPNIAVAGKKTVGLRIPAHSFARFLADNFKNPITATSASIFGEPP